MKALPTFRQLQFFIALARRQSFSLAAEDCLVSQSTLSAGIKEMERIIGQELVDRSSRTFALTSAGEDFLPGAEKLIAYAEDLVAAAENAAPLSGPVSLGVIPTIAPFLLPTAMPIFSRRYPALHLFLREDKTEDTLDLLRAGQIDMALIALPYETGDLHVLDLGDDTFMFACHRSHPLARKKRIFQDDLNTDELMLLDDGHCLRDHALSACGLQPKETARSFRSTSLMTLSFMISEGLGTSLFPLMGVRSGLGDDPEIIIRPFSLRKGDAPPSRQIGLVWRKGSSFNKDAAAMAEVFRTALNCLVGANDELA